MAPARIAGLSIPKSGTHLLGAVFKEMGYRQVPNPKSGARQILDGLDLATEDPVYVYVYGHWRCRADTAQRLKEEGFRIVVLIRDPRDICLSMADYIRSGRHAAALKADPGIVDRDLADLRRSAIAGFTGAFTSPPIGVVCEGWKPWQDHGGLILRYEDIGRSVASGILMQELSVIGIDPRRFLAAAERRFKANVRTPGRVRWRSEFDADLTAFWNTHATGVAASLGYEEC